MGNFNSDSGKQNTEELITYQEYLDRRPRNTKLSQMSSCTDSSRDGIQIIHKVYYITPKNNQRITKFLAQLQQMRNTVDCDNLYLPVMYKLKQNDSYCSEDQKLQMFFEYYEVKLKEEVKSRRSDRDFFSQEEVWYILYSLVRACRKFEKYGMASGPLKTSMVLLNQKGHLKLINILSAPEQKFDNSPLTTYFAPEQLKNLRQKYRRKLNPNACQTFAIGMILLQVSSLIDSENLYDMRSKTINEQLLGQILNFVQKKYSKLFTSLVKTMVSFNDTDRPLPSQIYDTFKPYEKNILNLKPFKFSVGESKSTA